LAKRVDPPDLEEHNLSDTFRQQSGSDTSPLEPEQLSDDELGTIFEIERRLDEAKETDIGEGPQGVELYLSMVQRRHPRVLLLDGSRGTGKTSLLLTLVERWHLEIHDDPGYKKHKEIIKDAYKKRIEKLQGYSGSSEIPTHIRVLDILDFDPLTPGMPLIAGIMQAWRPLAEQYDQQSGRADDYDDEEHRLMDLWHGLFRMAAVGWAAVPGDRGLIEQVLDREEQVQDWQRLDEQWRSFVTEVIKRGKKLKGVHKLKEDSVFVIMIDDVDLQVGRIRELLPALRLLYHPRVVFLVAADQQHMIHMLKLDFFGQQNELARQRNANNAQAIESGWAADLANSAFEKVFPKRNRMKVEWLSIREFLAFPGQAADLLAHVPESLTEEVSTNRSNGANFFADLKQFKRHNSSPASSSAGQLILDFAQKAEQAELPGIMTYRAAEQLRQYVMGFSDTRRAVEVLARLLSGKRKTSNRLPGERSVTKREAHQVAVERGAETIDIQITGELAALYRPGPRVFGVTYDVVLSGRPDFVFVGPADSLPTRMSIEPENRFNFTAAMIALMLQEAKFDVDATGLRWETYLSHAWTEWALSPPLSFAWTRHEHPRPDRLFEQSQIWADFIKLPSEAKDERKLERYAFAWIYYQRQWSGHPAPPRTPHPMKLNELNGPLPWDLLLTFKSTKDQSEIKKWQMETLPLLARPELGLPPSVQNKLLRAPLKDAGTSVKEELQRQRRRLVTDAFVAAAMQRGTVVRTIPDDDEIEGMIKKIDKIYQGVHSEPSPWREIEEIPEPNQKTLEHDKADRKS
jgi:KAP-like P-loop domain-containing protein